MANRNWMSGGKLFSMHKDPTFMEVTVQIGATGAVSSYTGAAVQSVTRISAGKYSINFQTSPSVTNFPRLLAAHGTMQSASGGISGISVIEVQNAPNTSVASTTAPSLTVTCLAPTDASTTTLIATDPASGSALNVLMILGNSSVTIQGD